MSTTLAAIGLGSNLGDRLGYLQLASRGFQQTEGVRFVAQSPVYETPPLGYTDQPAFLNMVLLLETSLDANALLSRCAELEDQAQRKRLFRNGPRTLDVDILFLGDEIRQHDPILPHPRLHERRFALQPLCDIAPDWVHPLLDQSVCELLQTCPDDSMLCLVAQHLPEAAGYDTGLSHC